MKSRPDDVGAVRHLSVKSDLNEARKTMGYCPQFDGIQPNMTAREHLRFYAMIRGVPPQSLEQTVEELLGRMNLVKYADRQVGVPHPEPNQGFGCQHRKKSQARRASGE